MIAMYNKILLTRQSFTKTTSRSYETFSIRKSKSLLLRKVVPCSEDKIHIHCSNWNNICLGNQKKLKQNGKF